ncbi:hypothetical protein G5B38_20065 (plasmid) [Pseudohalocynthiibacter aestuariivivens]|uniref:Peptidoglycan lipid II flippase n=1 Tax=Roseovarius pelagicus TaxID=2980108 RepID=A0ABY6D5G0_9RHOB|nr:MULTISPECIES: lipid II flippase MurJ [Rhodobacterales]QIE47912.1 hypothetical protein G5B38_20065 [Pseudohalocynthiibacter aestuariivivens]UXX81406.1 hypothetical protein N7U68_00655 [Roseovarius pelagicus]
MARSVLVTSALIGLVLLLSRLTGFLRELLLASQLGVGKTSDAAVLMLTFPDFMVGFLLAGGLSAAIVPALKKSVGTARIRLFRRIAMLTVLLFSLLAVGMALTADTIIALMAPALISNPIPGFADAFRVSLLALPVVAYVGAQTSYLNTVGRFVLPNISVLIFNLIICFYLAFFVSATGGLMGLALILVIATLTRLGSQMIFAPETLRRLPQEVSSPGNLVTFDLLKKFIFGVISYGVIVGAPIIFRSIYATGGEGYLAVFSFAKKLFDLPTALMVAPLVTILLPKLAAMVNADDGDVKDHVQQALTAGLAFVGIIAISGLIFMPMIADLIYLHGAMTPAGTAHITLLAQLFFLALPFYAMMHLGAIALSAQGRVGTVLTNTLIALGLSFAVTFFLQLTFNTLSAPVGFVAFHIFAGILNIGVILGKRCLIWGTWHGIFWGVIKTGIAATPFVLYRIWFPELSSFWLDIGLLILCGLCLSAVNLSAFRVLHHMRIDTT